MSAHVPSAAASVRELYYRAVFEAFLRYIAAGEPISIRTSTLENATEVTLRFETEAFGRHMQRLGPVE